MWLYTAVNYTRAWMHAWSHPKWTTGATQIAPFLILWSTAENCWVILLMKSIGGSSLTCLWTLNNPPRRHCGLTLSQNQDENLLSCVTVIQKEECSSFPSHAKKASWIAATMHPFPLWSIRCSIAPCSIAQDWQFFAVKVGSCEVFPWKLLWLDGCC